MNWYFLHRSQCYHATPQKNELRESKPAGLRKYLKLYGVAFISTYDIISWKLRRVGSTSSRDDT
jgi:hypothetical protein